MNGKIRWDDRPMKELKEILESEIEICERLSKAKSLPLRKRSNYEGRSEEARLILDVVDHLLGKDDGDE